MGPSMVRFTFAASVPMAEVEATLRLAVLAVESLHGEDRVRLETQAKVDRACRVCRIDCSTQVGHTLALVFGGYVRREFGDQAVEMVRMVATGPGVPTGVGA